MSGTRVQVERAPKRRGGGATDRVAELALLAVVESGAVSRALFTGSPLRVLEVGPEAGPLLERLGEVLPVAAEFAVVASVESTEGADVYDLMLARADADLAACASALRAEGTVIVTAPVTARRRVGRGLAAAGFGAVRWHAVRPGVVAAAVATKGATDD